MSSPSRNEPCHCGSGRKYKQCHLAEDRANGPSSQQTALDVAIAEQNAREAIETRPLKIGLVVSGLVASVAVGFFKDLSGGLIVAAAWALASSAYLSFRSPPPPNENPGDPAGLNFGSPTNPKDKK
jgi:hypothetical protein